MWHLRPVLRILSLSLGAWLLFVDAGAAQEAVRAASSGNRFLFVVDTSFSMARLDPANRSALFHLLHSGLDEQMQPGDTFGLWTFNEQVYTGQFPMQTWEPSRRLELASRATQFLRSQTYRNQTRMELLVDALSAVMRNVPDLHILILTDNDTPLKGTPLDRSINASRLQREAERRKAKKPFVLTLTARGGQLIAGQVMLPGEPFVLPASPPRRLEPAETPPLAESRTVVQPAPVGAPSTLVPAASQLPLSTQPATVVPVEAKAEAAPPEAAAPPAAKDEVAPPPVAVVTSGPPPSPATEAPVQAAEPAQTSESAAVPTPLAASNDAANPGPEVTASPTPPPATAPEAPTVAVPSVELAAVPIGTSPSEVTAVSSPTTSPSAQAPLLPDPPPVEIVAASAPSASGVLNAWALIGAGSVLLVVAVGFLLAALKRVPPPQRHSFISRSMERR